MNKLKKEDVSEGYYDHHLEFGGLGVIEDYNDNHDLSTLEKSKELQKLLTKEELIDSFEVSPEVAEKLVGYQSSLIASYRDTVTNYLQNVDRYLEVKPYLKNRGVNKEIITLYVENNWDRKKMLKEFNPISHLRNGLIAVSISVGLFLAAVVSGWNTHTPSGFDFVSLGIVTFIWLGITFTAASQIPSNYRARKIIYKILSEKSQ